MIASVHDSVGQPPAFGVYNSLLNEFILLCNSKFNCWHSGNVLYQYM